MTLPPHDAQPSRSVPRRPSMVSPTHSIPPYPQMPATAYPPRPSSARPTRESTEKKTHGHALDFATNSWDLATGGLKTLTAKREMPRRPDRRIVEVPQDEYSSTQGYTLILILLTCIVLMLAGGGVVLFVMLQH